MTILASNYAVIESPRSDSAKKSFEKDHSVINIKITHDSGMTMNVTIRRDKERQSLVYNAYVNFVANDRTLEINDIRVGVLSELVKKYRYYVEDAVKKNEIQHISIEKNSNTFSEGLRSVKELEDLASFVKDLRKIDTFTIDVFANKTIARTTIELDADITTVIPQGLLDDSKLAIFLNLQYCNVYLANQLFESHIKILLHFLVSLNRVIKLASVVPFALSLLSSLWDMSALPAVISALAIPFLYRYVPRIIFRYGPKIILQVAPRIIQ